MGCVSGLLSKILCGTFKTKPKKKRKKKKKKKTKPLRPHVRLSKSEFLGGGPGLGKLLTLLRSFQETAEVENQALYE